MRILWEPPAYLFWIKAKGTDAREKEMAFGSRLRTARRASCFVAMAAARKPGLWKDKVHIRTLLFLKSFGCRSVLRVGIDMSIVASTFSFT